MMFNREFFQQQLDQTQNTFNNDLKVKMLDMWANLTDSQCSANLLRMLVMRYADSEKKVRDLNNILKKDLESAAAIQKTMLPDQLPNSDRIEAAWRFQPCDSVGGDIVFLETISENLWLWYIIDVAGHGLRAAMITVAIAQFLRHSSEQNTVSPLNVMRALEKEFPFTRFASFFTIIFGTVDLATRQISFCNSGHPPPILAKNSGETFFIDKNPGPMLGLGLPFPDEITTVKLEPGDSFFLYTDGLTECVDKSGSLYGEARLLQTIQGLIDQSAENAAQHIFCSAKDHSQGMSFKDDFTLLMLKARFS